MNELWVDIPEYPNYMISNQGRVRHWKAGTYNRIVRRRGEPIVYLRVSKCSSAQVMLVSNLVGEAFCPEWSLGKVPRHLDGDQTNNRVTNLMWEVRRRNLQQQNYPVALPGRWRTRIVETDEVFVSQKACAEHINGSQSAISDCLNGHRLTYMGYTFERIQ